MTSTSGQKVHLDAPPSHPVVSSRHLANASWQLVISSCRRVNSSFRPVISSCRRFHLRSLTCLFLNLSCRPSTRRIAHQLDAFYSGFFFLIKRGHPDTITIKATNMAAVAFTEFRTTFEQL